MLSKGKMKTFGELSDTIAGTIIAKFQFASQAHIVPDRYDVEDSIKSGERSRRSRWTAIEINIQGRETKLPARLKRYLSIGKNKPNLLTFLLSDWCENLPGQLKDGQTLILASQDGSAVKVTKTMNRENIIPFYCGHEEADVAVLGGYHFSQLSIQELWFHTGTGRNRRFIPVHKAVEKVGQNVCNLLPAMHALTECNSTSNLNGIGKN